MSVAAEVKKELDALPEGWIVLLETSADKALDVGLESIRTLTNDQDYHGLVVSASRPCTNLKGLYKKHDINMDNIFILDLVCKSQTQNPPKAEDVLHLESVSALTDISIAVNETIQNMDGKRFVFIDSITTMLIHNNPKTFARFAHSILTKLRIHGVSGLLISIEGNTEKEVRAEIAQLCDKVIKL